MALDLEIYFHLTKFSEPKKMYQTPFIY